MTVRLFLMPLAARRSEHANFLTCLAALVLLTPCSRAALVCSPPVLPSPYNPLRG
jgi:hypothetical protein